MRTYLKLWLILFPVNLVLRPLLDYAVYRRIDLTDVSFFQLITVPALQSGLLWWISRPRISTQPKGQLLSLLFKDQILSLVLLCDLGMMVAGWAGNDPASSLDQAWRVPAIYVGLKAISAGLLLLSLLMSRRGRMHDLLPSVVFVIGLLLFGIDCFGSHLTRGLERLFSNVPLLLFREVYYGGFLAVSLYLLLRLEKSWKEHSPAAALLMEIACGSLFAYGAIGLLNLYNRPVVHQPWLSVIKTLGLLCVSCIWMAVWEMRIALRRQPLSSWMPVEPS